MSSLSSRYIEDRRQRPGRAHASILRAHREGDQNVLRRLSDAIVRAEDMSGTGLQAVGCRLRGLKPLTDPDGGKKEISGDVSDAAITAAFLPSIHEASTH
jgi:hypothetical protein